MRKQDELIDRCSRIVAAWPTSADSNLPFSELSEICSMIEGVISRRSGSSSSGATTVDSPPTHENSITPWIRGRLEYLNTFLALQREHDSRWDMDVTNSLYEISMSISIGDQKLALRTLLKEAVERVVVEGVFRAEDKRRILELGGEILGELTRFAEAVERAGAKEYKDVYPDEVLSALRAVDGCEAVGNSRNQSFGLTTAAQGVSSMSPEEAEAWLNSLLVGNMGEVPEAQFNLACELVGMSGFDLVESEEFQDLISCIKSEHLPQVFDRLIQSVPRVGRDNKYLEPMEQKIESRSRANERIAQERSRAESGAGLMQSPLAAVFRIEQEDRRFVHIENFDFSTDLDFLQKLLTQLADNIRPSNELILCLSSEVANTFIDIFSSVYQGRYSYDLDGLDELLAPEPITDAADIMRFNQDVIGLIEKVADASHQTPGSQAFDRYLIRSQVSRAVNTEGEIILTRALVASRFHIQSSGVALAKILELIEDKEGPIFDSNMGALDFCEADSIIPWTPEGWLESSRPEGTQEIGLCDIEFSFLMRIAKEAAGAPYELLYNFATAVADARNHSTRWEVLKDFQKFICVPECEKKEVVIRALRQYEKHLRIVSKSLVELEIFAKGQTIEQESSCEHKSVQGENRNCKQRINSMKRAASDEPITQESHSMRGQVLKRSISLDSVLATDSIAMNLG